MRRDVGSRGPQGECRTPNPAPVRAQGRQGWRSDWSLRARLREILRCQQGLEVSRLSSGEANPVHRTGDIIFSVNFLALQWGSILGLIQRGSYQPLLFFISGPCLFPS